MKVYVLIGEYETSYNHQIVPFQTVIGVFPSKKDAVSYVQVEKACGDWRYNDYDIEEHDL